MPLTHTRTPQCERVLDGYRSSIPLCNLTIRHAAASYGHIEVLEYLISQGVPHLPAICSSVPLTTVKPDPRRQCQCNRRRRRYAALYRRKCRNRPVVSQSRRHHQHSELRRHIGKPSTRLSLPRRTTLDDLSVSNRTNKTAQPTQHLEEEFPAVAAYLRSISDPDQAPSRNDRQNVHEQPSQHTQNIASEFLTSELLSTVQEIMERSEREGTDPDEELRAAVGRTVMDGVVTGFDLSEAANAPRREDNGHDEVKRTRTEEGHARSP